MGNSAQSRIGAYAFVELSTVGAEIKPLGNVDDMGNDSVHTSLTFTHPLRRRSKKWVSVYRGSHGQESKKIEGYVRRVEITWWQKVLGFLDPQYVGCSQW